MHAPERYSQRSRYWPAVLKIIGALPSRQLQQAMLLSHNLGLQYTDDGQPQHLLTRPRDLPLLDQHFWLLDDWAIQASPKKSSTVSTDRVAFEENLFIAATFTFLTLYTRSTRLDPHSFFDGSYQALEE